jgi:phage pi2 protein 07
MSERNVELVAWSEKQKAKTYLVTWTGDDGEECIKYGHDYMPQVLEIAERISEENPGKAIWIAECVGYVVHKGHNWRVSSKELKKHIESYNSDKFRGQLGQ